MNLEKESITIQFFTYDGSINNLIPVENMPFIDLQQLDFYAKKPDSEEFILLDTDFMYAETIVLEAPRILVFTFDISKIKRKESIFSNETFEEEDTPIGTVIKIERKTDLTKIKSTFFNSSILDPMDLDRVNFQLLHRLEEEANKAKNYFNVITGDNILETNINLNENTIFNIQEGVEDTDAVTLSQLNSKIINAQNNIQTELNRIETETKTYTDTRYQNLLQEILTSENNLINLLDTEVNTITTTINNLYNDLINYINDRVLYIDNQIINFNNTLSNEIQTAKNDLLNQINQVEIDTTNYINTVYNNLSTQVTNDKNEIETLINNLDGYGDIEGFEIGDFILSSYDKNNQLMGEWGKADVERSYLLSEYPEFNDATNGVFYDGNLLIVVPAISTPDVNQDWYYLLKQ